MAAPDPTEALEDKLYALRQQVGDDVFPKPALDYLNDWAAPDKSWLRQRSAARLPLRDLVRVHIKCSASSASVLSPLSAAIATFALNADE